MTFSIVARCDRTQMFGVAVTSSSPAVAARCAFAQSGVGAVATQNITDPRLGPRLLHLMTAGSTANEAISIIKDTSDNLEFRQLLSIDGSGETATYSGDHILGIWSEASGVDAAAAGNLLANRQIPAAMIHAFQESLRNKRHLGDRLINALVAGVKAGGEAGAIHSAGMLIVDTESWPLVDLRIDWTDDCPVHALSKLWDIYCPQMEDYVTRALSPTNAPSYGVPGDE